MASIIHIQVDDEIKERADALFADLGTDIESAIIAFLRRSAGCDEYSFDGGNKDSSNLIPLSET